MEELLAAGIEVLTTVNVQHLESLNDVVQTITGVAAAGDRARRRRPRRRPGRAGRHRPRRRCAGGWRTATSTRPDRVDAALGNYFRLGNLTALRELALLWLAGKVDEQLDQYRTDHHIAATWETRERVVVALTGGAEGDTLIRRAARIAARNTGADLLAVHVTRSDGLDRRQPRHPGPATRPRREPSAAPTTTSSATTSRPPCSTSPAAENATQLVLGACRRGRLASCSRPASG